MSDAAPWNRRKKEGVTSRTCSTLMLHVTTKSTQIEPVTEAGEGKKLDVLKIPLLPAETPTEEMEPAIHPLPLLQEDTLDLDTTFQAELATLKKEFEFVTEFKAILKYGARFHLKTTVLLLRDRLREINDFFNNKIKELELAPKTADNLSTLNLIKKAYFTDPIPGEELWNEFDTIDEQLWQEGLDFEEETKNLVKNLNPSMKLPENAAPGNENAPKSTSPSLKPEVVAGSCQQSIETSVNDNRQRTVPAKAPAKKIGTIPPPKYNQGRGNPSRGPLVHPIARIVRGCGRGRGYEAYPQPAPFSENRNQEMKTCVKASYKSRPADHLRRDGPLVKSNAGKKKDNKKDDKEPPKKRLKKEKKNKRKKESYRKKSHKHYRKHAKAKKVETDSSSDSYSSSSTYSFSSTTSSSDSEF